MNNPFINQSVSHATLRTQDLLSAFVNVYEILDGVNGETIMLDVAKRAKKYVKYLSTPDGEKALLDDATEFLHEVMFDELNRFAPVGYYFGATEGDGSDFGFWRNYDDYEFLLDERDAD